MVAVTQSGRIMADWCIALLPSLLFLTAIVNPDTLFLLLHLFFFFFSTCFSQRVNVTLWSGIPGRRAHRRTGLLPPRLLLRLDLFPPEAHQSDFPVIRWFAEAEVTCHLLLTELDSPLTRIEQISSGVAFVRFITISWAMSFLLSNLFTRS